MFEFLGHPGNLPFAAALVVLVGLGIIELVGLIIGIGLTSLLDDLLPDLDFDSDRLGVDVDIDAGVDALDAEGDLTHVAINKSGLSGILRALSWLGLGRVPILVYLVLFIVFFSCTGLIMQMTLFSLTNQQFMLPGWISWVPALIVTVPMTRIGAYQIGKLVPKVETDAVSEKTFIGRVAKVTLGNNQPGEQVQARLADENGQNHYVMVKPDSKESTFEMGDDVLLVKRENGSFRGIHNPSSAMTDV